MRIFLDTANVDDIKKHAHLLDGVTTNPSLIAKEGRDFKQVVTEICDIVDGPVSAEVVSENAEGMVREARDLSKIHENVVIKIPMTEEGLKAVQDLAEDEDIVTNVTLVFSPAQALLAAIAGADYVSPFVGRLDDIGQDGMQLVEDIVDIFQNYELETEVIVASVRSVDHVVKSAKIGADIATIPPKILEEMFKHPKTDEGIKKFMEDWAKVPKPSV